VHQKVLRESFDVDDLLLELDIEGVEVPPQIFLFESLNPSKWYLSDSY
jgi:hypothetical protein